MERIVKILVCGGRNYSDKASVDLYLDKAHKKSNIKIIICGGASGADRLAKDWAESRAVHCAVVDAIWYPTPGTLDRGAGPKRNRAMLLLGPDAVIAFPGGPGTEDMVKAAKDYGITVWRPLG